MEQVSYINHRIRIELNITVEEYIVAEAIANLNGFDATVILDMLRISPSTLSDVLSSLTKKKILLYPTYGLSNEWLKHFNYDEQFDILWAIHPKGTKKIARKRWDKLKGKVDFNKLKEWLMAYVASKPKEKYCFLNGLDVILVPENKRWENPIIPDYIKQEERRNDISVSKPISNFFASK